MAEVTKETFGDNRLLGSVITIFGELAVIVDVWDKESDVFNLRRGLKK